MDALYSLLHSLLCMQYVYKNGTSRSLALCVAGPSRRRGRSAVVSASLRQRQFSVVHISSGKCRVYGSSRCTVSSSLLRGVSLSTTYVINVPCLFTYLLARAMTVRLPVCLFFCPFVCFCTSLVDRSFKISLKFCEFFGVKFIKLNLSVDESNYTVLQNNRATLIFK